MEANSYLMMIPVRHHAAASQHVFESARVYRLSS
jgi:hypothetical protein